jgi:hypothetical protein
VKFQAINVVINNASQVATKSNDVQNT